MCEVYFKSNKLASLQNINDKQHGKIASQQDTTAQLHNADTGLKEQIGSIMELISDFNLKFTLQNSITQCSEEVVFLQSDNMILFNEN